MLHSIDIISQVIALFLQCATLITVFYGFFKFTQKPTDTLNSRVAALEQWRSDTEQWRSDTEKRLQQGNVHFMANDESNRVTQNALVAIMDALGQMETVPEEARAEIKTSKKELMDYLTDK